VSRLFCPFLLKVALENLSCRPTHISGRKLAGV
jgi:hypothetical protein